VKAGLSAGILLYRTGQRGVEVLLAHMGGPFWKNKDAGAWSLPKGECNAGEDALAAARREFAEELGSPVPAEQFLDLGEVRQAGGKRVRAWAARGDLDAAAMVSNTFDMEWPRGSGKMVAFPEVDRAQWFSIDEGRRKVVRAQAEFLDRLIALLQGGAGG
jgi:predicted NUDIX family NTP pyrophosphohydrolase